MEREVEICFLLTFNDVESDKAFITDGEVGIHAHLVRRDKKWILKLYYKGDGAPVRGFLQRDIHNRISNIEVININKKDEVKVIDFSNSRLSGIEVNSSFIDNKLGKYIEIRIENLRMLFKNDSKKKNYESEFYLNEDINELLEKNYGYFGFIKEGIWEATNREDKWIYFKNIQFKLKYHFYTSKSTEEFTHLIRKEPILYIRHNRSLKEEDIVECADSICTLLTFATSNRISYTFARIYGQKYIANIFSKKTIQITKNNSIFLYFLGINKDVFKFLESIEHNKIDYKFLENIVNRYVLALRLEGESQFMIFYNLIERIRFHYIGKEGINETFKFDEKISKTQLEKQLKERLKTFAEFVDIKEQEEYKKHIITLWKTVRYLPMKDQLNKFFTNLGVNIEKLDFEKYVSWRNTVFHGGSIYEECSLKDLEDANIKLMRFVGVLILNLLGIKEGNHKYQLRFKE